MKTNLFSITLLATVALMFSSCYNEDEIDVNNVKFDDGVSAVRISAIATRSEAEMSSPVTSEIGSVTLDNGETFILEETLSSLDDYTEAPETRGTPSFTKNYKDVHGSFNGAARKPNGDPSFKEADANYTYNETDKAWEHRYGQNIWENLPTWFFLRMPGNIPGVTGGKDGLTYNKTNNELNGSISFSYESPEDASAQTDILFTSYKRTHETNGEDVVFYHALTGVKFANYYDNKDKKDEDGKPIPTTKTNITKVTLKGLKNKGTCTVTPPSITAENGTVSFDNTKRSYDVVSWPNVSGKKDFTLENLSSTFANYAEGVNGKNIDLTDLNTESAKQNLNDNNATLTFFFVPQTVDENVKIEVIFDILVGEEVTKANQKLEVSLSEKTWRAGELRTYILKPTAVGVDIVDTMEDYVKSDVKVRNTGNVHEFVRVSIIGNWVGQLWESGSGASTVYETDKTIMNGYESETSNKEVVQWNDKDPVEMGGTTFGTFVGLPQPGPKHWISEAENTYYYDPGTPINDWIRRDKYYYYTIAIGPGEYVPDSKPVFKSYTIPKANIPAFWIADDHGIRHAAGHVHLEMDLMVQSIEAYDADGNLMTYDEAWKKALAKPGQNWESVNLDDL